MKLGFSILSHQTPGLLFQHLLTQLDKFPDKEIAIHHDFNQASFEEMLPNAYSFHLVKNYVRTYWSHTNNITAILETFKILYVRDCDWYITLSANCYPIKPVAYILDFLHKTQFDGFIERNSVFTDYFDFYQYFRKGFETKYLFTIPFLTKKGQGYKKAIRKKRNKKEIPFNESFIPYHGSDWLILNKRSIEYLLKHEAQIKLIVNFLSDVNKGPDINVCPPEIVFQTVLGNNSGFNFTNDYYRFIDWENAKNWHPNTVTMKHWEAIKKSDALFARKFDWENSQEVIALINKEIL